MKSKLERKFVARVGLDAESGLLVCEFSTQRLLAVVLTEHTGIELLLCDYLNWLIICIC